MIVKNRSKPVFDILKLIDLIKLKDFVTNNKVIESLIQYLQLRNILEHNLENDLVVMEFLFSKCLNKNYSNYHQQIFNSTFHSDFIKSTISNSEVKYIDLLFYNLSFLKNNFKASNDTEVTHFLILFELCFSAILKNLDVDYINMNLKFNSKMNSLSTSFQGTFYFSDMDFSNFSKDFYYKNIYIILAHEFVDKIRKKYPKIKLDIVEEEKGFLTINIINDITLKDKTYISHIINENIKIFKKISEIQSNLYYDFYKHVDEELKTLE
jgi:hypothetical protein